MLDHIEHFVTKGVHQFAGVDRADAMDHARSQVFFDPFGIGGW
jgi:hypothetical protein